MEEESEEKDRVELIDIVEAQAMKTMAREHEIKAPPNILPSTLEKVVLYRLKDKKPKPKRPIKNATYKLSGKMKHQSSLASIALSI